MNIIKKNKFFLFISLLISVSILLAMLTRFSIKEISFSSVLNELKTYPFYLSYPQEVYLETFDDLEENSDVIALVEPTDEKKVLGDSIITKIKVKNSLKGDIEDYIYIVEPISLHYEKYTNPTSRYISSIFGYNFMKSDKEYIVLLNESNNIYNSKEVYIYTNVYLGKFPRIYNKYDYNILDNNSNNTYENISSYEQLFNNNVEFDYYSDIYNNIILKYSL